MQMTRLAYGGFPIKPRKIDVDDKLGNDVWALEELTRLDDFCCNFSFYQTEIDSGSQLLAKLRGKYGFFEITTKFCSTIVHRQNDVDLQSPTEILDRGF